MPTPRAGEKQSDFISRCVKQVVGEGKTQDQALGQCYGVFRQHRGGTAKLFCEVIKQPTGQSTHQQTALGNDRALRSARGDRKKERQLAIMAAAARQKQPDYGGSGGGDESIGTEKRWSLRLKVQKAEPERQMIFGWASVVAKDGNYIIDKQGDIIPISELENAVLNYMLESRDHGVMHSVKGTGKLVMSFLTTPDFMKAFKLKQEDDQIGWIAGYKIEDPALWEAHKRGLLPEFSIGGSSVPFEQIDDGSPPNWSVDKKEKGERIKRPPFR